MEKELNEHEIIKEGLVCLIVCSTSHDGAAVAEWAARERPTGTSNGRWRFTGEAFTGGESNPGHCGDYPVRRHFLLGC